MLVDSTSATAFNKRIAVRSGSTDFDAVLQHLLHAWGFEVCPPGTNDALLLAGDNVATDDRQQVIRLTSSHYHGRDRLSLPLQVEELWQTLEHHFHRPPRMHIRMAIDLPARVTIRGQEFTTTLSSLSDMGARIFHPQELVRDERVSLQFAIASQPLRYVGCVIFSAPLGEQSSRGYRIGVVFHGLKKDQRDLLRHYLVRSYLETIRPLVTDTVFQAGVDNFALPAPLRQALRA